MGLTKKLKNADAEVKPRTAAASSRVAEAPVVLGEKKAYSRRQNDAVGTDKAKREKYLKEGFCPETIAYLKENFGIDVQHPAFPYQAIYDLSHSNVTQPLDAVITPVGFDEEAGKKVEFPKIRIISSFKFVFPRENGKPVAPSKDKGIWVKAYPCHDFVSDRGDVAQAEMEADRKVDRKDFTFTNEQILALKGIGISDNRILNDGFNSLSIEQLACIRDGKRFEFDGQVETPAGFIDIAGTANPSYDKDGRMIVTFTSNMPKTQKDNEVLDLDRISKVGNIELDLYERNRDTHEIIYTDGRPTINQAAMDLLKYGVTFEPVRGTMHQIFYDSKEKEKRMASVSGYYQVAVMNGSLVIEELKKVDRLNEKGEKILLRSKSGSYYAYDYVLRNPMISKEGTIRLSDGNFVKFASEADERNYRMGKGARVLDAEWSTKGKDGKVFKTKYDAFVISDPLRGGLAKHFSPEVSRALIARFSPKVQKVRNYGKGLGL